MNSNKSVDRVTIADDSPLPISSRSDSRAQGSAAGIPVPDRQTRILRLDASANPGESHSRRLGDLLLDRLRDVETALEVRVRNLNRGASFIDGEWIAANLTDAGARSARQARRLADSDALIAELEWADRILLTLPMYNFSIPATLKAWIDQVCRAGITFRYTADGPQGLLTGKSADVIVTTGGAPLGSPVDFASGYLAQVLSFIGIDEVNIIGADRMNVDTETSLDRARSQIAKLYPGRLARRVA